MYVYGLIEQLLGILHYIYMSNKLPSSGILHVCMPQRRENPCVEPKPTALFTI